MWFGPAVVGERLEDVEQVAAAIGASSGLTVEIGIAKLDALGSIVFEKINVTKDQEGLLTGHEDDQNRPLRELEVSSSRKLMNTPGPRPSGRVSFLNTDGPGRTLSSISPAR